MPLLTSLGWDDRFAAAFAPHRAAGLIAGRVSLEHNHLFRVMTEEGEWLSETTGRIRHLATGRSELPVVGDWVALRPPTTGTRAAIVAILPRRSWFSRKAAGRRTTEQVLSANIDMVFIVAGLDLELNVRSLERYLVLTRTSGAEPVIVLNKSDACADLAAVVAGAEAIAAGAPVLAVSTRDGRGFDALNDYAKPGATIALLGPSGVGKSSIINRLLGRELLAIGEVRSSDHRGRHTSVHRQLVQMDSGALLIDTPGLRELQLWEAEDGVGDTFAEIGELAGSCRFRDCRHDQEPGCAVRAAVAEGRLGQSRYDGYLKLLKERETFDRKRDERIEIERKRQTKVTQRSIQAKQRNRES